MNLRDNLIEDTILNPMLASNREEAIQELLTHLQNLDILSGTEKLFSTIEQQENAFSSATGRGIAFPHSISLEVGELVCILGISSTGIDFHASDGQLCHLILLTLSPKDDPEKHRKFISRFRTMVGNPEVRSELVDTRLASDTVDIVHQWEMDESQNNLLG